MYNYIAVDCAYNVDDCSFIPHKQRYCGPLIFCYLRASLFLVVERGGGRCVDTLSLSLSLSLTQTTSISVLFHCVLCWQDWPSGQVVKVCIVSCWAICLEMEWLDMYDSIWWIWLRLLACVCVCVCVCWLYMHCWCSFDDTTSRYFFMKGMIPHLSLSLSLPFPLPPTLSFLPFLSPSSLQFSCYQYF